LDCTFDHYLQDHGFDEFLETRALTDPSLGFLNDGWITLNVDISVLPKPIVFIPQRINSFQLGEPVEDSAGEEMEEIKSEGGDILNLDNLPTGARLSNRYIIGSERVSGKPHVRYATIEKSGQGVVLKFFSSRESFEKAKKLNKSLPEQYVCKALDVVDEDGAGLSPFLVFERGTCTLDKWIQGVHVSLFKRKAVLHEVCCCLKSIHSCGIVHCDIKASNIMYFPSSNSWKLLNTHLGFKKGEHCLVHGMPTHLPPEMTEIENQRTAVAKASVDMWAFGIVASEALTGDSFLGPVVTLEMIEYLFSEHKRLNSDVEDAEMRRMLRGMLNMEPEKRWSASRVLTHATFKPFVDNKQKAAGSTRKVGKECRVWEKSLARGRSYEVRIRNLCCWNLDEEIESKTFEADGKKWKLAFLLCEHNSGSYEIIKVLLVSCNDAKLHAHVGLTLKFNKRIIFDTSSPGMQHVAGPFGVMARKGIEITELTGSHEFEPEDELVVRVDLKDVEAATEVDGAADRRSSTINLEVIDHDSIKGWMNDGKAFGLAPTKRDRPSDVNGCSLARFWASKSPDRRYWLCNRDEGCVSVERCLNEATMLERFEDIGADCGGGFPWISVFEEPRADKERFPDIDGDTCIVFCKMFQPPYTDVSYLGHLFTQRTATCQDVLTRIAYEMAKLPDRKKYDAYLEKEGHHLTDITSDQCPLSKYGKDRSYVIVLRERTLNEVDISVESIKSALESIHSNADEINEDCQ